MRMLDPRAKWPGRSSLSGLEGQFCVNCWLKSRNDIRSERMSIPLKVRKDDETVPTREILLKFQRSVMVTKLLGMYRFDMYQQVNGQDADR